MTTTWRSVAIRIASVVLFFIVLGLYVDRPDLGTIGGVIGTGVVAAVTLWAPRRELLPIQLLAVILGLPIAMLLRSHNESTGEQLLGGLLFGKGSVLEAIGLLSLAVAGIVALLALAMPRRQRQPG